MVMELDKEFLASFIGFMDEQSRTMHHEAGHAVADFLLGLRPRYLCSDLNQPIVEHDRRVTRFLHTKNSYRLRSEQRIRLDALGMSICAGVTAEWKSDTSRSIEDLWLTSGRGDYEKLKVLAERAALCDWIGNHKGLSEPEYYISAWKAGAATLLDIPEACTAVEGLVRELESLSECGERLIMRRKDLMRNLVPCFTLENSKGRNVQ